MTKSKTQQGMSRNANIVYNCGYEKARKETIEKVLEIIKKCADHRGIINEDDLKKQIEELKNV